MEMELKDVRLWDRIGQSVVIFAILLISDYFEGGYQWEFILGPPILIFVGLVAFDIIRGRESD